MGVKLKKFISIFTVVTTMATCMTIVPAQAAEQTSKFDPETVMWTNNPVENVLAAGGVYETMKDVDPNADKNAEVNVQKPYEKDGTKFKGWGYSEYIWTNGYPVGNGRMAGMVAGGINNEVIQINEDTCWDGGPYGTLKNEKGETITTVAQAKDAETITAVNMTSGSVEGNWRYFRGADENGNPAEIGSANAVVGDEEFRTSYPAFANKSISNQALNISNEKTQSAVEDRWNLHTMVEAKFLGNPTGQRAYKSFVEVYLDFGHDYKNATNYTKSLDMKTGVVTVEYDHSGSHYKRETFASYPDQAVVTHVTSDSALEFNAELHTYHNQEGYCQFEKISNNEVKVTASVYNGNKDNNIGRINVIKFEARMLLDGDDDSVFTVSDDNKTVSVSGGNEATIYVVGATNYVDYKTLDNSKPARDCEYYMTNVKSKTYEKIKERHIADFTEQFSASELTLANKGGADYSTTPTEKRVRKDVSGKAGFTVASGTDLSAANKAKVNTTYQDGDNQLAVLEFNYGKYLMLSGARDGRSAAGEEEINIPESQPLNLTGKWNAAMSAGWNGKYTININTEMNYWAAQPLNIGTVERTLIDTFADLAESGSITAAYQYGIFNERGDNTYKPGDPWVMHHNYDLWRGTQPIDNATAGLWPTGGAWLLDHAWQYYRFNKDEAYLAEVYPYMVGAAKFFTQFLVVDQKTGYLITAASCSPEQGGVQPGPAMDTQLVRNLYDMVLQASDVLGKTEENAALIAKIKEQMPSSYFADEKGKIAPNLIDKSGWIQEWTRGDVSFELSKVTDTSGTWNVTNIFKPSDTTKSLNAKEATNNTGHRHMSHLWELFPGTHLSGYSDDPQEQKIYKAFQNSITNTKRLTADGKGWSLAWRMNLLARAQDGNNASSKLEQLFVCRTAPNLFDQHPDFQIDGNYGATSGILEMLLQSHDGAITLLPALPDKWSSGSFSGFNTREGATVDLSWSGSKPTTAKIHATETKDISVRSKYMSEAQITDQNGNAIPVTLNGDRTLATFAAQAGKTYTITNFGTNVVEGDKTYPANKVTEFYASDKGTTPKADGDGVSIGYIYNRENVKIGYAVKDFDFDGLKALTLNMKSVRDSNIYVSIRVDSTSGTEIANQTISTGVNDLTLKNTENISGEHKIYVLYYQSPYSSAQKYLGNALDLVATYSKTVTPSPTPTVTPTPTPTPTEDTGSYDYKIASSYFGADGKLNVGIEYSGSEQSPSAVLIAATYNAAGKLTNSAVYPVSGSETKVLDYEKPASGNVKLYIWKSAETLTPMSAAKTASNTATSASVSPTPTNTPAERGVYIGETKYDTVKDAVEAASAINPASEEQRVYIDITPGVYREQVVVKTPYVTIRRKPGTSGEVKLTWYYGLGTLYDSCNESGYYDPSVIGDGKAYGPNDWGPSLKVDKSATGFTAENLYIENSYNAYYTQEELTDIAGVDPKADNSNFHRLEWIKEQIANGKSDDEINTFLQSRTSIDYKGVNSSPRERSAALHCSADKAQFINCTVMSTQDTIGINSGRMYFKNCKLGGTTDYICGSATAVFDGCELYTNAGQNGSATKGESATITAPSNGAESEGYLFWNCRITGTKYATPGSMGRPWGQAPGPAAYYINTTIGAAGISNGNEKYLISNAGWSDMSGNLAKDARFGEYGSVYNNGSAADVSGRTKGKVLNEWTMLRFNPWTFTKGNDGWDPAGAASSYANVENILNTTSIDTSDGTTSEIALPSAPSGYEFNWESSSEYAAVSGKKLALIRPANGEAPIEASVTLYVRESGDRAVGAKKTITFDIQPSQDTTNVFTVSGTVNLSKASDTAQTVTVCVKKGSAIIKTINVEIPAGDISKVYTAENIPVGAYTLTASTPNTEYNIVTADADITGAAGDAKTFNVEVKKLQTISIKDTDFSILNPSITSASGFSALKYTATGDESANLGAGNVVYRLTKESGKTVAAKTGVSFNLNSMLPSGSRLDNAKTIKFSFDFLMETTDYYPNNYSYFDLVTSVSNAGADKADPSRFVRWGVYKGWGQLNMFDTKNSRINGDKTQFDKNNTMANRWFTITADIDLETNTITTTLYDRDKDMEMLNGKPFPVSPNKDGLSVYPTDIDLNNLCFNIYMDKDGSTTNKMEYFFDNISLEYQDFE